MKHPIIYTSLVWVIVILIGCNVLDIKIVHTAQAAINPVVAVNRANKPKTMADILKEAEGTREERLAWDRQAKEAKMAMDDRKHKQ